MSRVPLLVCGTALRGDDGAALAAVLELPPATAAMVEVHLVGQLDADILVAPGMQPCVVVDTVVGVTPGALVELSLAEVAARGIDDAPHSSHSFALGRAIRLAETVAGNPVAGRFVGIGGVDFRPQAPLSAPVAAALPALRDAIADALTQLDAQMTPAHPPGVAAPCA